MAKHIAITWGFICQCRLTDLSSMLVFVLHLLYSIAPSEVRRQEDLGAYTPSDIARTSRDVLANLCRSQPSVTVSFESTGFSRDFLRLICPLPRGFSRRIFSTILGDPSQTSPLCERTRHALGTDGSHAAHPVHLVGNPPSHSNHMPGSRSSAGGKRFKSFSNRYLYCNRGAPEVTFV